MIRSLKFLQANLNKSRNVQHALHNDDALQDFTAILGQEPNCFTSRGKVVVPGTGRNWVCFTPPPQVGSMWPVRACMWVRADVSAVQLPISCADIAAAVITLNHRRILAASVYIPSTHAAGVSPSQARDQMQARLQLLRELIRSEKTNDPEIDIVVAGDFNRHDTLWGGPAVGETVRQGEAEPIITFIDQAGLQSMLLPGEITFERSGLKSTIDLSLASTRLAESLLQCTIWPNEYGSDHRAVVTEFDVDEETVPQEARLLLKHAQWPKVRDHVAAHLQQDNFLHSYDIDELAAKITSIAQEALERHCPKAKPSPYAKRWWNADLTALRQAYTMQRNAARSVRRTTGHPDAEIERKATAAKHLFHHTIRRVRKQHWEEFLDDVTHVWKATKYLNPQSVSSFARVPMLNVEGRAVQDKVEIADELIAAFFPQPPVPEASRTERPLQA